MGFKRANKRMENIEGRLREGMQRNGISGAMADSIVRSITSFALYGFPESHAASFALIAYASAYLKCHHAAAFFAAMLNCYPLGFYHPATLVKDAERHQVKIQPIDVAQSDWRCTIERGAIRLGLKYVAGLREETGLRAERERIARPFDSIADFTARVAPNKRELDAIAYAGAFAAFGLTRREALWQVAGMPRDPLFAQHGGKRRLSRREKDGMREAHVSPLPPMSVQERTLADYKNTGITVGPHLMTYLRADLDAEGVLRASDLPRERNGRWVKTAGLVIVRQRPGTGKGFCFLTLEDETGLGNVVITPDMFQRHRSIIHTAPLLLVEGPLQHVDGVIHVRARAFRAFTLPRQPIAQTGSGYRTRVQPEDETPTLPKSHDFR
jgi:error-prone DNA polymerase